MSHFDCIPAGKKEIYSKEKGGWILVDLEYENMDDLKIILDEREAENKELKKANNKLMKTVEKMNTRIIDLESKLKK